MNSVYLLAVLAIASQAYSQVIPSCAGGLAPIYGPGPALCAPTQAIVAPAPTLVAPAPAMVAATPTVITTNSVAANLADTLSLLTVTSLLAETLPYSCPAIPAPIAYPGCGYGYLV